MCYLLKQPGLTSACGPWVISESYHGYSQSFGVLVLLTLTNGWQPSWQLSCLFFKCSWKVVSKSRAEELGRGHELSYFRSQSRCWLGGMHCYFYVCQNAWSCMEMTHRSRARLLVNVLSVSEFVAGCFVEKNNWFSFSRPTFTCQLLTEMPREHTLAQKDRIKHRYFLRKLHV